MKGNVDRMSPAGSPEPADAVRSRQIHLVGQVGRYVGVGVFVTLIDYLIFLLAVHLGLSAAYANVSSKVAATLGGGYLHRRYTFAGPQHLSLLRQIVAYAALSAFNLALSTVCIVWLMTNAGWPPLVAKLCADILVIAISFVASRVLIYAPSRT